MLERPSRASPQPEVFVDQNLVQYFRGLELVSDKMDNLSDQVIVVEHGLNDIRGNMKILWRKANEREDAQNILSKIWSWKSNINEEYKPRTPEPWKPIHRCSAPSIKGFRMPSICRSNVQYATIPHHPTCHKLWRGYMPNCGGQLGNIQSRK